MIIIKTILKYSKLIGIFILLELFISFIMGFLRLLGLSSGANLLILLIINIFIFLTYGYLCGKNTNIKGIVEGLRIGTILISILFIISLIFFFHKLSIATIFYYTSLLFMTIIGSTIGKNKKEETTGDKK